MPVIPPDTRGIGQAGHVEDHNAISDVLSAQAASISTLQGAIAGSILGSSQQNGNYTLALTDLGTVVEITASSAAVITVPASANVAFPIGAVIWVFQAGTGTVTLAPAAGVTIVSFSSFLQVNAQWQEVKLRQRSLNNWALTGSLI